MASRVVDAALDSAAHLPTPVEDRPCWFVGATYGRHDQTERFLRDGIWEHGFGEDRKDVRRQVNAMQPGDRIAIKASFTKKHDLPFNARGAPCR